MTKGVVSQWGISESVTGILAERVRAYVKNETKYIEMNRYK
jgi:hypothetical protein